MAKIKSKDEVRSTDWVKELKQGDLFCYDGDLCMRTDDYYESESSALNLESGGLWCLEDCEEDCRPIEKGTEETLVQE